MISTVNTTTTTQKASAATASPMANGDFTTFLKMLTAQIQNQDPLNPMESTDFAVQLATFSGVEQQAQTNKLLSQMVEQGGAGVGLGQVADWIGKEARTTNPTWFGNDALTLDIDPHPLAEDVVLYAFDETGKMVSKEAIGPGKGQIDWLGRDEYGQKLPDGLYSFVIQSTRAGETIEELRVGVYAKVVEAGMGEKGPVVFFENGGSALASDISGLRQGA